MSGRLYTWGESASGQLGNGTFTPDVTTPTQIGVAEDWEVISAGGGSFPQAFALAIRTGNTLWSWGESGNGQLGNGTITPDVNTPTQVGSDTDWSAIAAGYFHALALKSGGSLWAWGFNNNGQLGDGSSTQRTSPVHIGSDTDWEVIAAGSNFSAAIKSGGTLYTWGRDNVGQLGNGAPAADVISPTQVGAATDWASVSCGANHAAAITTGGKLYTWGENATGQLGHGDTTIRESPTQVGAGTNWAKVSCGDLHTLALKTDGTLWACGDNVVGTLGDGTTTQRTSFVQIGSDTDWADISAGAFTSFALKTDGTLYAWGEAASGGTGNGTTTPNVLAPVQIGSSDEWTAISGGFVFGMGLQATAPPPNEFWTGFVGTSELLT